jgi:uncharacterized protein (TIGR02145 family)
MSTKKFYTFIFIILLFLLLDSPALFSQTSEIKSVLIGNQEWQSENLNTFHYRNGDKIPFAKNKEEWVNYDKNHIGAWCYYCFKFIDKYEKMVVYNWWAVKDERKLAPEGWHIPSFEEWNTLIKNIGCSLELCDTNKISNLADNSSCADALKSTEEWAWAGTNSTGFNALPYARMTSDGSGWIRGNITHFWTTTQYDDITATGIYLSSKIAAYNFGKGYGFYIRLLKDNTNESETVTEDNEEPTSILSGLSFIFRFKGNWIRKENKKQENLIQDVGFSTSISWGTINLMQAVDVPSDLKQTKRKFSFSIFDDQKKGFYMGKYKFSGVFSKEGDMLEKFTIEFEQNDENKPNEINNFSITFINVPYSGYVNFNPLIYNYSVKGDISILKSIKFKRIYNQGQSEEIVEECNSIDNNSADKAALELNLFWKAKK